MTRIRQAIWPLVLCLLFGLAGEARAQEEEQFQRIQQGLNEAIELLTQKKYDEAIETYEEVLELVDEAPLPDEAKLQVRRLAYYNTACAYSLKGEKEAALDAFEKSLQNGFADWDHIVQDTDLDNIRNTKRFKRLVRAHKEKARAAEREALRARAREILDSISDEALFDLEFQLETIDGETVRLSDYRGRVVLLDIWGTWCPPCRRAVPHLIELQKKYQDQGLTILGLNHERTRSADEALKKVRDFVKKTGIPYDCALINRDFLGRIPQFEGFPTLLFVDRKGRIRLKLVGYHDKALLDVVIREFLDANDDEEEIEDDEEIEEEDDEHKGRFF